MTKPTCLGTRLVFLSPKLDSSGGSSPSNEGLLIVFRDQKDRNNVQVSVCNGTATYTGEVAMDQVKLSPEDRQQLAAYLLQDKSKHAAIEITFLYSQDEGLELNIKQCLMSGLKKFAYSTVLLETEKASVLQCLRTLGDSLNASIEKNDRRQEEMREVQQRLDDWKDTALKLDKDVWQLEKDQLLQNFLTLFNDAQTKAKEQLKELQEELDLSKRTNQHRGGTRALAPLLDTPDDLDEPNKEPIPLDEVAALAQGKQTITTRKSILDPSDILCSSDLKQKTQQYKEQQQATKKSKANKAAPAKKPSLAPAVKKEKKPRPKPKIPIPSFGGSLEDDSDGMPPASKRVKQENEEPVELKEDSEEEAMRRAIRDNIRKDKATVTKGEGDSSKTKDDPPTKLQDEAMRRREELWKKVEAMGDDESSTDDDS
jgi:hypothetical protein